MDNNEDFRQDDFDNDNEYQQEIVEQLPQKIKLEITTTKEWLFTGLSILSALITIAIFAHFSETNSMINPFTLSAIAITVLMIVIRLNIDEYYVLDTNRQALMLRSKIFSKETYTVSAPFKMINASVGNARYNSGGKNRPGYWEYRAEIMLRTGKVIPIDDWHKRDLSSANIKASRFAKVANIEFIQGKKEVRAKPILVNGVHTFIVKEEPPITLSIAHIAALLIVVVFFIVYFALIAK